MDDVVEAFAAEGAALDRFLAGLDDASWRHDSACAGWTVSDVVLHLAQTEEAVVACFALGDDGPTSADQVVEAGARLVRQAGADAVEAAGEPAARQVDAMAGAAVADERPDDPAAVLDRWRTAHAASLACFRAAGAHRRVPWVAVPLSARTLAATRLSEHWIHGLDVREPLGDPPADTDRLRFVARLAWRTLPYAFAGAGEAAPSVALRLDAPGGGTWSFGDDDAEVTVTGPGGDWCRVAARRLRPAATALVVRGERARRVLDLVRTYA